MHLSQCICHMNILTAAYKLVTATPDRVVANNILITVSLEEGKMLHILERKDKLPEIEERDDEFSENADKLKMDVPACANTRSGYISYKTSIIWSQ